ncbi:MAG: aldehyde dehydrogenase family protein [Acetobacteraceae bacterium]|nr:aldehyde dehydrogenase family protein [Acetobacteraceae bacterium]
MTALSRAVRDFVGRRHKLLINGEWVDAQSGKTFPVFDPSNGQQIAECAEGEAADVDKAVAAARRAFEEGPWPRLKPTARGKLVWKLGDLLEAHADELAELESLDCAPARCGSMSTTSTTSHCRSAATSSRAGAGKWATRRSSSTPRPRRERHCSEAPQTAETSEGAGPRGQTSSQRPSCAERYARSTSFCTS